MEAEHIGVLQLCPCLAVSDTGAMGRRNSEKIYPIPLSLLLFQAATNTTTTTARLHGFYYSLISARELFPDLCHRSFFVGENKKHGKIDFAR